MVIAVSVGRVHLEDVDLATLGVQMEHDHLVVDSTQEYLVHGLP